MKMEEKREKVTEREKGRGKCGGNWGEKGRKRGK